MADWTKRLARFDVRYIYWIMAVLIVLPLLRPWNLPVGASPVVKTMFDGLDELQPGDRILLVPALNPLFWNEQQHGWFAVIQHFFLKDGVKMIVAPWNPPTPPLAAQTIAQVKSNPFNKEYGVDYALMPFTPGGEFAFVRMAQDFRGTFKKDFYGTPIEDLPVWDGVESIGDFKCVYDLYFAPGSYMPRHFVPKFPDAKYYAIGIGVLSSSMIPYLGIEGGFDAGFWGIPEVMVYQRLYGGPYSTGILSISDSLSMTYIFSVAMIIFTNFLLLRRRFGGK